MQGQLTSFVDRGIKWNANRTHALNPRRGIISLVIAFRICFVSFNLLRIINGNVKEESDVWERYK